MMAMLSAGDVNRGVIVRGIDPAREDEVADIGRHMRRGSLAAVTADFVEAIGATTVIVSSAELPPARVAAIAKRWRIPVGAVQATAFRGAMQLELDPGQPGRLAAL